MAPLLRNKPRQHIFLVLALLSALGGWGTLLLLSPRLPAQGPLALWGLFVLLTALIKGLGNQVVPRETHSLVGILDLAALLVLGPVGGAWVAAGGALLYQVQLWVIAGLRAYRERQPLPLLSLAGNTLFDGGLKIGMALASFGLYRLAGGRWPIDMPLQAADLGPAAVLFLAWFAIDHLGWGAAEWVLGGWAAVREWFLAIIGPSLLLELLPLPLSLLVVAAYQQNWLTFLLLIGGLIGTSFVIQRLFRTAREQRRLAHELATLNEVARAIVQAEMSVEGLGELILEQAGRVVDTSIFHLGLLEGDRFTLQIRVSGGVRQDPLTVSLAPGEGIIGWMRQSKQPLLVRDFQREMDSLPARPRYLSDNPPRSAVFVPLLARGEVIGSLSIQSMRPGAFTEQHLRILTFISNQAAIAIEKARLYEAARERAVELERIAQENAALYAQVRAERDRLELLYDVGRDLTRRLDLDDLLQKLLQRTVESIQAEDGTIVLLGTRRDAPRLLDSRGERHVELEGVLEKGLAGWVIEHRRPAIIADVRQDPRWLPTRQEVGSALAVPILHGENALGVITLTHPQVDFFAAADPSLPMAIAEQAAMAIEASRLYRSQRRRAVQLQTISQVMRSILSILEIDPLLNKVVHLVRERFGFAHVHIFTLDPDGQEVVFRASTNPDSSFWQDRGGRLPVGEGLIGWVAIHGEPANAGDVTQDRRWLPDQPDVRSEIAVPLKVGEEVVGVLDVQSGEKEAFDDEDTFILLMLADQIAVALETARLYAAQQEEAWVLNALLQVAENISQSRDLDELTEVVVRLVPLLVGVEHCLILLRDREGDAFRAVQGYGVPREDLADLRWPRGALPAFDRAVAEAQPVALAEEELRALPAPLRDRMGSGALWLLPLLAAGEVSGMLLLGMERQAAALSPRQQTILGGITNQAGIAIEEARLRRAEAERQRLDQELAVAREIQRSLLPPAPPQAAGWSIDMAWQSARRVGGDFYDFIPLPDNHLGVVIADVSDKGVPAALFMVLSRSLVRASALNHHSPAEALKRANRLLQQDNRAEMFVTVFYGVIDLKTGEMRYASAGHNPPLLCRGAGDLVRLEARGIVLGIMRDAALEEQRIRLEPGDTLMLYTDGVTEAIDEHEEQFGEARLQETLCAHHDQPLGDLRQTLLDTIAEFTAGQPPFDDLTLVLVRREEQGDRGQRAGR